MTKATKTKLNALQSTIDVLNASQAQKGGTIKYLMMGVAALGLLIVFFILKRRRR